MTSTNYQGQSDPCLNQESESQTVRKLSEKSLLPINVGNSLQQQTSNTSTQINSLHSCASEPVCRICHSMSNTEQLMSLCHCSGSIGQMHVSCLQRWLGSSNKTQCELCHFNFVMERKPKPFYVYLANPGTKEDRRRLIFDIVCICLLLPITLSVVSMCIYGASLFRAFRAEFIGIVILATLLSALFSVWFVICVRLNIKKWREWKQFNQEVKLKCSPPIEGSGCKERSSEMSFQSKDTTGVISQGSHMGMKISSIEIKVKTEGQEEHNNIDKHFMESIVSVQKITLEKPALQCGPRPFNNSQYCHTGTPDVPLIRHTAAGSDEIPRVQSARNCVPSSSFHGEHRQNVIPHSPSARAPSNREYSRTPSTDEARFPEYRHIFSSQENSTRIPCSSNGMAKTQAKSPFPETSKGNTLRTNNSNPSSTCMYPKKSYI